MSAAWAKAPSGVGSAPVSTLSAAAWRPSTEWIESAAARMSGRLDVRRLAEVGRRAEVLHRRRELQHRLRVLERELRLRRLGRRAAELLGRRGERVDVLLLGVRDVLDQREVVALEQAAAGRVVVEGRLEVLERQRVIDDPEVALAELRGHVLTARRGRAAGRGLVVAAAGGEERRRRAGAADGEKPSPRDRIGCDPPERAGLPARRGNGHRSNSRGLGSGRAGGPPSSPCPTRRPAGPDQSEAAAAARRSATHRSRIQCSAAAVAALGDDAVGPPREADALPVGRGAQGREHRLDRPGRAGRRPQALALGADLERVTLPPARGHGVALDRTETPRPWRSPA